MCSLRSRESPPWPVLFIALWSSASNVKTGPSPLIPGLMLQLLGQLMGVVHQRFPVFCASWFLESLLDSSQTQRSSRIPIGVKHRGCHTPAAFNIESRISEVSMYAH